MGEYREVMAPGRIVRTFIVDVPGIDEHVGTETMTLEGRGGRTKIVEKSTFTSTEELEGTLPTGMVGGALDTYDRLAVEIAKG